MADAFSNKFEQSEKIPPQCCIGNNKYENKEQLAELEKEVQKQLKLYS